MPTCTRTLQRLMLACHQPAPDGGFAGNDIYIYQKCHYNMYEKFNITHEMKSGSLPWSSKTIIFWVMVVYKFNLPLEDMTWHEMRDFQKACIFPNSFHGAAIGGTEVYSFPKARVSLVHFVNSCQVVSYGFRDFDRYMHCNIFQWIFDWVSWKRNAEFHMPL